MYIKQIPSHTCTLQWYTDQNTAGHLELTGTTFVNSDTIRSGGHLVLLQDQDSVGRHTLVPPASVNSSRRSLVKKGSKNQDICCCH